MADKAKIEWTDASWNPVTGCSKVSAACKHCYAERDWVRLAHLPAYKGRAFTDVAWHPDRLKQPLQWKRPRKIFVNSMSDLFHPDVPFEFIDEVFAVMALSKQHIFQVLTKRPERMLEYLTRLGKSAKILDHAARRLGYTFEFNGEYLVSWPILNVWLGVSVEDQATAEERIPMLLRCPAAVRWISAEPLLGAVDLSRWLRIRWPAGEQPGCDSVGMPCKDVRQGNGHTSRGETCFGRGWCKGLEWVVAGGESGAKARPMNPQWARSLRDQCGAAGVPFLFKQHGEFIAVEEGQSADDFRQKYGRVPEQWPKDMPGVHTLLRVGRKAAGRLLDGEIHDGYPKARRIA